MIFSSYGRFSSLKSHLTRRDAAPGMWYSTNDDRSLPSCCCDMLLVFSACLCALLISYALRRAPKQIFFLCGRFCQKLPTTACNHCWCCFWS